MYMNVPVKYTYETCVECMYLWNILMHNVYCKNSSSDVEKLAAWWFKFLIYSFL